MSMRYKRLGDSGLHVSQVALGTFNFGGPTSAEEADRIIGAALDAGINLVDTANVYQDGCSEEVVGTAIAGRRDEVLIATKVYNRVGPGPNDQGNSAYALHRECERSLRRLGTDYIDIYYLHRHDLYTPLEETMQALDDLVSAGKVRYVGTSTVPTPEAMAEEPAGVGVVPAWRIVEMVGVARRGNGPRVVSEQAPYNLVEREIERHVLPICRSYGVGLVAYSPLAMGLLTDRFSGGATPPEARFTQWFQPGGPRWRRVWDALGALEGLAAEHGLQLSQFAHAWTCGAPGVTSTVLGPRDVRQLKAAVAGAQIRLDEAARAEVDRIVPPGTSLWFRTVEAARRAAGGSS